MALPAIDDDLSDAMDAMVARFRAAAADLAVEDGNIVDSPVDPTQVGRTPAVEVYAGQLDEPMSAHGHPRSDDADMEIMVVCKVALTETWRAALFALMHRVKVALLTDAAFVRRFPPRRVTGRSALDGGVLVVGVGTLTFSFARTTEYPPVVADDLTTADIDVDMIAEGAAPDGQIDAKLTVTLPTE